MGVSVKPFLSSSARMARNAAVHHVARRDDVRAGLGVAGGACARAASASGRSKFCGRLCRCRTNAAMAVLHVFAQANVGDDQQRRQFLFQQPHGLLDDAVLRVSAGSLGVLFVGNAEKQDRGNAERMGARRFAHEFIRRKLEDAGHGVDGAAQFVPARANSGRTSCSTLKRVSADEPPQRRRLPQPARAINGKSGQIHGHSLVSKRKVQSGKFTGRTIQT